MGVIEKHEEEFCGLRFGFVFRIKQQQQKPSSTHCKHLNKAYQQWARGAHRSRLLTGDCQRWERETEPGWSEATGTQGGAQTDPERGWLEGDPMDRMRGPSAAVVRGTPQGVIQAVHTVNKQKRT